MTHTKHHPSTRSRTKTSAASSTSKSPREPVAQTETTSPPSAHTAPAAHIRTVLSRHSREASYQKQLALIREELPPHQRFLSFVVHFKPLEVLGDVTGATIFRPNALLAGSLCAFVAVTFLYVIAKQLGYTLSGFETIAAFLVGWLVGTLYDVLRLLVGNKKHHR